jgi:hypothetical protein
VAKKPGTAGESDFHQISGIQVHIGRTTQKFTNPPTGLIKQIFSNKSK